MERSYDAARWSTSSAAYGAFAVAAERSAAAIASGGPIRLECMPAPKRQGRDDDPVRHASITIGGIPVGVMKYSVLVFDQQVYPQQLPPQVASVDPTALLDAVAEFFKRTEGTKVVMFPALFLPKKAVACAS